MCIFNISQICLTFLGCCIFLALLQPYRERNLQKLPFADCHRIVILFPLFRWLLSLLDYDSCLMSFFCCFVLKQGTPPFLCLSEKSLKFVFSRQLKKGLLIEFCWHVSIFYWHLPVFPQISLAVTVRIQRFARSLDQCAKRSVFRSFVDGKDF